jgi:hypothetical protein
MLRIARMTCHLLMALLDIPDLIAGKKKTFEKML